MEAIYDPKLYIWYFNFGHPGSLNDINILDRSSIVGSVLNQEFNTKVPQYYINGTKRDYMYFLVDGIYPSWSMFVKSIALPMNDDENKFAKRHEHVRKDIERCFGVLVSKFGILERPLRGWYIEDIKTLVDCCVIIHNMTIEYRRKFFVFTDLRDIFEEAVDIECEYDTIFPENTNEIAEDLDLARLFVARAAHMSSAIKEQQKHIQLQTDLLNHVVKYH